MAAPNHQSREIFEPAGPDSAGRNPGQAPFDPKYVNYPPRAGDLLGQRSRLEPLGSSKSLLRRVYENQTEEPEDSPLDGDQAPQAQPGKQILSRGMRQAADVGKVEAGLQTHQIMTSQQNRVTMVQHVPRSKLRRQRKATQIPIQTRDQSKISKPFSTTTRKSWSMRNLKR